MDKEKQPRNFRPARSVTRIIIGSAILSAETLAERLRRWENPGEERSEPQSAAEKPQPAAQPAAESAAQPSLEPLPEQLPPPALNSGAPPADRESATHMGYALVGLLFEGEETLERWWNLSVRAGKLAARVTDPLVRPLSKLPNPVKKPIDNLADRGQSHLDRWVNRGRAETEQSVQVAQTAATSTMDETITYMAQNPALEELVQQQSMSLAQEVLEQIRSMAVSADYLFEGLIRYLLRRPPRYLLPPPGPEVQQQARWRVRDLRTAPVQKIRETP